MKVVVDIEANGLRNPTKIWVIVCKNVDDGVVSVFREVTHNEDERERFLQYAARVDRWIGHNILGYDGPVVQSLLGIETLCDPERVTDTLIVSKLVDFPRQGHSIEDYGLEFGYEKGKHTDFSKWTQELEDYCIRDAEITYRVYLKYLKYINNPERKVSIDIEHKFQLIVNTLENNGFSFNIKKAEGLLEKVTKELHKLDEDILREFPPKLKLIREITPKETKHGTLNRSDFRWVTDGDLSEYNGGPFCRCSWVPFNPSSHKQIIDVLNAAGWLPEDKTQAHIDLEREYNRLRYAKQRGPELDLALKACQDKLTIAKKTGWKVNEKNLGTLPENAPPAARTLARRILLEARRRTLVEWLSLVQEDGRIHGKFYGIGAWTHRMAHQNPNTANIPSEFKEDGSPKLLGREMRSLWQAPRNRLLVGVDAEAIQLRIFAHYINDAEFTHALVSGNKADKTDPHSLNQRVLGSVCKTRAAAKRFIFALLLGAGLGKLAAILACDQGEAQDALDRMLQRYTGFQYLKDKVIPADAKRGWFVGLDGRAVRIPGETEGSRRHLCMSGYLQNGEAVVMKHACVKWHKQLEHALEIEQRWRKYLEDWKFVNFVHDEWQTEVMNDFEFAKFVAEIQANALKEVGEELKLNCPMSGSYYNEDHEDYTIGINWYQTH